jgi:hypothetical protein
MPWSKAWAQASSLIVGWAYHKNTNTKVERANGVIDTLRAVANGRKRDRERPGNFFSNLEFSPIFPNFFSKGIGYRVGLGYRV